MDFDFTTIVALVVAGIIAILSIWRNGSFSFDGLAEAASDIERVVGAAREWVLAADQLWQSGKLAKDRRFDWVLEQLRSSFPDLDDSILAGSIEAAVAWLKILRSRNDVAIATLEQTAEFDTDALADVVATKLNQLR